MGENKDIALSDEQLDQIAGGVAASQFAYAKIGVAQSSPNAESRLSTANSVDSLGSLGIHAAQDIIA